MVLFFQGEVFRIDHGGDSYITCLTVVPRKRHVFFEWVIFLWKKMEEVAFL